jgi:gliding motility-associated-like protein
MRKLITYIILTCMLVLGRSAYAQICDPAGNVVIYSNYDGSGNTAGTRLNINVDANIPNLKIGICSYERVSVDISGPYAGNVVSVIYAGYNGTTNNHCGSTANTIITGVPSGIITYNVIPLATLSDPDGYPYIICGYQCATGYQGGCNTPAQVVDYFLTTFGGGSTLYSFYTQYGCWFGATLNVSAGGNCCLTPSPGNPPVAHFTVNDSTICAGTCVNFTDQSTNTPTSWSWIFTGATPGTSSAQNPSNICYYAPGNYPVQLIATNADGSDTLVKTSYIVVTALPSVGITPTADTICPGDSTSLTAGGATTYAWAPTTGLSATSGANVMAGPTTTTTYTVTGNTSGCTATATAIVTAAPLPTVVVTPASTTICLGTSDTLVASGASSYVWAPSTGLNTTSGATVIANPSSTITYTVAGTDLSGCSSSTTVTVTVTPGIVPDAGSNVAICAGDSVQLNASGGTTYTWSTSIGLSCSNCDDPMASPPFTTTYTVMVGDGNCPPATDAVTVTVNPVPIATIIGDTIVCPGEQIILTATGGPSYTWSTGGTTASITYNPITPLFVFVTVSANGCADTAQIFIDLFGVDQVVAFQDTTITLGSSVQLIAIGGSSWNWSPATGLSCSNCPDPIASPQITTTYTVSAVDSNGCASSDHVTVTINVDCGAVYIPNVFSPNGDQMNDVLYVRGNCITEMLFIVYDRWGEKVFTSENIEDGWDGKFRNKDVNTGVYYYTMKATLYDQSEIRRKGSITVVR